MSVTPRIEMRVSEEIETYWVESTVNGTYTFCPIQAQTREQGNRIAPQIQNLIEAVYKQAYQAGHAACQEQIKNALGVK